MPLDDAKAADACDLLLQHRQRGTQLGALPEALRPATRAEGYRIQAQLERRSAHSLSG